MVPQRRSCHYSWQVRAGGLGALVLFAPLSGAPRSHHNTPPFQDSEAPGDLDSTGWGEAAMDPVPPVVAPPAPVLTREQRAYKTARSLHRGYFGDTDRSLIPKMMQDFRQAPSSAYVFERIDWLAERDALIDRAQALGYVIGELRSVVSGTSSWSAVGMGLICGVTLGYPIGGRVSPHSPVPRNGDAALLNRGWTMIDPHDTEPRPHVPIPIWFLRDPTLG